MKTKHQFSSKAVNGQLIVRSLIGAAIASVIIVLLLSTVDNPNPAWGQYWMIRPLLLVPLAGAGGGAVFHAIGRLLHGKAWQNAFTLLMGLLAYIVALWMGIVIGLDGTLWN